MNRKIRITNWCHMCKCNGDFVDHLLYLVWLYPPLLEEVHLCGGGAGGNSRSFEDTESSMLDLKLFFFRTLLDWLSALRNLSLFSIVDLLDICNFCNWLFTCYISCILGWLIFLLYIYIYIITYQIVISNIVNS